MRWTAALVPLALLSSSVVACSSDEPAAPGDHADYELHEWTTVLPTEVLEQITEKDDSIGTIRFRGAPEIVRAREPGDVLLGGKSATTPRGILRAVVSVKAQGEDTVVETIPVPLPLAFKRLHAKIAPREVDVAAPSETTAPRSFSSGIRPAVYTTSKVVGDSRVFDAEAYNQDKNPATKDDQMLIHAELSGSVGYSASVDLDWLDDGGAMSKAKDCLKEIVKNPVSAIDDCVPIPDVRVSFQTWLKGNGLLDVEGASSKKYESDPIPLNEEPWELPEFAVGPVLITPELDFTAKVEGDASTAFHARTEFGYDISVGAAAGVKSGVTPPDPKFTRTVKKPVVEVTSTGYSKASFGPRISLLAYDTFGFYAELHGKGELFADKAKTPCWDFVVGAELVPGIRLRIPWKKFGLQTLAKKLGWDADIVNEDFGAISLYEDHPFADAPAHERACGDPPLSALPLGEGPTNETYLNPTFTPWSVRLSGFPLRQPAVAYPGESKAIVEKAHDGSWLLSGTYLGTIVDLNDKGEVNWARAVEVGQLEDEKPHALHDATESVLALASDDMRIFAAGDRLTLFAFDYDGTIAWAKRLRAPGGTLPDPMLLQLSPTAMAKLPNGDFGVLFSRRTVEGDHRDIVLVRATRYGLVRFAKRFRFPDEDSVAGTLVAVGDDLVVGGTSSKFSSPGNAAPILLRFDANGAMTWAKRLDVCGSQRAHLSSAVLRASGDLAVIGSFDIFRSTFFATLSPEGDVRGATAQSSDATLEWFTGVNLAELPTTGFVTMEQWSPATGTAALALSTRDSLGVRTGGKTYGLVQREGTGIADLRAAGLRLTTDGGALTVAHVHHDKENGDYGLWISKVPARTFEAAFDPTHVTSEKDAFPSLDCTVTTTPVAVTSTDEALDPMDVKDLVKLNPIMPLREPR